MNRKNMILIITIVIITVWGGVFYMFVHNNNRAQKMLNFSVNEYAYYIENFASDKILGEISSSKDAIAKAERVWIEIYGKLVKNKKPYKVFYNNDTSVWLITGSLKQSIFGSVKGGIPYILIQKSDGKVLAVWHDK